MMSPTMEYIMHNLSELDDQTQTIGVMISQSDRILPLDMVLLSISTRDVVFDRVYVTLREFQVIAQVMNGQETVLGEFLDQLNTMFMMDAL